MVKNKDLFVSNSEIHTINTRNSSNLHYPSCIFYYYYYLVSEAIGTAATPGLLCQLWVIMKMIVEKQMECRLAGETEVLGENLPLHHF
jgi:hypothetical protein